MPLNTSQGRSNKLGALGIKRVFEIDLEHCPDCGGAVKIIAAIEYPAMIVRILTHFGLATRAPPRSPARRLDLFIRPEPKAISVR